MKFLNWLESVLTVPNVLLSVLLLLATFVLLSALRSVKFRLGDMLVDERGKASSSRVSMFVALGLSSYILAYLAIHDSVSDDTILYIYAVYLITWAGSKTLDKLVTVWFDKKGSTVTAAEPAYRPQQDTFVPPEPMYPTTPSTTRVPQSDKL